MQVKISQAIRMLTITIKAGLVPLLVGSPAIGKSGIVHQVAKEYNLKVIDLRLSQCDPTDLLGFPGVNEQGKAIYRPMESFPIKGDPLPLKDDGTQYDGWLLFLDELTSAPRGVQAAAYKLILDRMVGLHHLHEHVAIVAAGNKDSDGAIVEEMSTALQSRLVHFELVVDNKEWLGWATGNNIDYRITSYINFMPKHLYDFRPDHTDHTYAAPRTWEMAHKLIHAAGGDMATPELLPLLSGTISEGVAREFTTFCHIFNELPKIADIEAHPNSVRVPGEPSILFALSGSLSHHFDVKNARNLLQYINRMPMEFQMLTLREAIKRNPGSMAIPEMQKWIQQNAKELF